MKANKIRGNTLSLCDIQLLGGPIKRIKMNQTYTIHDRNI